MSIDETIWKSFKSGRDLSSVKVVLPGGERVVVVEALVAVRVPALMEFVRREDGEIDLTNSGLEAFALKAVLGDAHCENLEVVCEEYVAHDIVGLKAVLHAADYCGAERLKSWVERKIIETHVNDTDHRTTVGWAVEAHKRNAKRLLEATQDALSSAPKDILKVVPSEILAETVVHLRDRKKVKRTTLVVFGNDPVVGHSGSLIVKEVDNSNGDSVIEEQNFGPFLDICVSPDGTTVVSGHHGGKIVVWKVHSWKPRTLVESYDDDDDSDDDDDDDDDELQALACSCNGILGATYNKCVILWDIESGDRLHRCDTNVSFCPVFSGPHFFYMSFENDDRSKTLINILDCEKKLPVGLIKEDHASLGVDDITSMAFSGPLLAVGSRTGVDLLEIQDFQSITRVHSLRGHTDRVTAVAANSDGTRLAAGCGDGTIRIWCVTTESCLHVFHGHEHVDHLTFLLDDITVASANIIGGDARFWDTAVGDRVSIVRAGGWWSERGVISCVVIF